MVATQKTEARWRALIREQESSGRTVQDFARGRGLSTASLYWWRSRLRRGKRGGDAEVTLARVTLLRPDPMSGHLFVFFNRLAEGEDVPSATPTMRTRPTERNTTFAHSMPIHATSNRARGGAPARSSWR